MNRARHEVLPQLAAPSSQVDGIFVVGMFASGTDLLGAALSAFGLRRIDNGAEGAHPSALAGFNEQLLTAADGSRHEGPPEAAPLELARTLAGWADEAREKVEAALAARPSGAPAGPWVWDDPRLSFLAPFWADVLGVRPAVILVHRSPGRLAQAALPQLAGGEEAVKLWDRYNRSALVLCSQYPSLAVPYDDVVGRPKALLDEIARIPRRPGGRRRWRPGSGRHAHRADRAGPRRRGGGLGRRSAAAHPGPPLARARRPARRRRRRCQRSRRRHGRVL